MIAVFTGKGVAAIPALSQTVKCVVWITIIPAPGFLAYITADSGFISDLW